MEFHVNFEVCFAKRIKSNTVNSLIDGRSALKLIVKIKRTIKTNLFAI